MDTNNFVRNIYGYCRVSARDQNLNRQILAMEKIGINKANIYMEKISGKIFERSVYNEMVENFKQGDILYITSLDRLSRNYDDILEQWRIFTKEVKIDIVVIDMPLLDTRTTENFIRQFIADLVLQVLSFVAQTERENIRERQAQGIRAAHERGVKFGRPLLETPPNFEELVKLYTSGMISIDTLLITCNFSKSTFYRRLKSLRIYF